MILRCPVCEAIPHVQVLRFDEAPIFQLLKADEQPTAEHFAPLDIVRCGMCEHLYNRAYSEELSERMYRSDVLSNVPVHVSMTKNLEAIADWIGVAQFAHKDVVEVGAGSGHLARILARRARSVIVFEPSAGLGREMVPEDNITLLDRSFEAGAVPKPVDLLVCRQVLEHVADPLMLLTEMGSTLADNGRLYLEVPRAEYIEERAALFDLHCAHVQYFRERNLLALAAKAGLASDRLWHLKGGHDFGVLLRRKHATHSRAGVASDGDDLAAGLERRRVEGREFLAALRGDVALYGATWHGVAFLNVYQAERRFVAAFDDNSDYAGYALYSRAQTIPVCQPETKILRQVETVLITAYLHDRVIASRLRAMGFSGRVLSARSEPTARIFCAL